MSALAGVHADPGLARGRSSLPAADREALQRQRLQRAIVSCTAEKGFAAVSVADIVSAAKVSRQTFYELYPDRESCLLDAADVAWEMLRNRIDIAQRRAAPDDRWGVLTAMVRAYLTFLAEEPEFTRLMEIDMVTAGPRAMHGRLAAHRRLASALRDWHLESAALGGWTSLPKPVYLAVVGAVDALVIAEVAAGRTRELVEHLDVVLDVMHRFFTGRPL